MITGPKALFFMRVAERGYMVTDVMPCVVQQDNDMWTVDETHSAYPHPKENTKAPQAISAPQGGAGTELKKLLARVGIKSTPTCSCNQRAILMDQHGISWCKENTDTIVGWLREEATKRKLPFIDAAGKLLVNRAIAMAEKAEKKRAAGI